MSLVPGLDQAWTRIVEALEIEDASRKDWPFLVIVGVGCLIFLVQHPSWVLLVLICIFIGAAALVGDLQPLISEFVQPILKEFGGGEARSHSQHHVTFDESAHLIPQTPDTPGFIADRQQQQQPLLQFQQPQQHNQLHQHLQGQQKAQSTQPLYLQEQQQQLHQQRFTGQHQPQYQLHRHQLQQDQRQPFSNLQQQQQQQLQHQQQHQQHLKYRQQQASPISQHFQEQQLSQQQLQQQPRQHRPRQQLSQRQLDSTMATVATESPKDPYRMFGGAAGAQYSAKHPPPAQNQRYPTTEEEEEEETGDEMAEQIRMGGSKIVGVSKEAQIPLAGTMKARIVDQVVTRVDNPKSPSPTRMSHGRHHQESHFQRVPMPEAAHQPSTKQDGFSFASLVHDDGDFVDPRGPQPSQQRSKQQPQQQQQSKAPELQQHHYEKTEQHVVHQQQQHQRQRQQEQHFYSLQQQQQGQPKRTGLSTSLTGGNEKRFAQKQRIWQQQQEQSQKEMEEAEIQRRLVEHKKMAQRQHEQRIQQQQQQYRQQQQQQSQPQRQVQQQQQQPQQKRQQQQQVTSKQQKVQQIQHHQQVNAVNMDLGHMSPSGHIDQAAQRFEQHTRSFSADRHNRTLSPLAAAQRTHSPAASARLALERQQHQQLFTPPQQQQQQQVTHSQQSQQHLRQHRQQSKRVETATSFSHKSGGATNVPHKQQQQQKPAQVEECFSFRSLMDDTTYVPPKNTQQEARQAPPQPQRQVQEQQQQRHLPQVQEEEEEEEEEENTEIMPKPSKQKLQFSVKAAGPTTSTVQDTFKTTPADGEFFEARQTQPTTYSSTQHQQHDHRQHQQQHIHQTQQHRTTTETEHRSRPSQRGQIQEGPIPDQPLRTYYFQDRQTSAGRSPTHRAGYPSPVQHHPSGLPRSPAVSKSPQRQSPYVAGFSTDQRRFASSPAELKSEATTQFRDSQTAVQQEHVRLGTRATRTAAAHNFAFPNAVPRPYAHGQENRGGYKSVDAAALYEQHVAAQRELSPGPGTTKLSGPLPDLPSDFADLAAREQRDDSLRNLYQSAGESKSAFHTEQQQQQQQQAHFKGEDTSETAEAHDGITLPPNTTATYPGLFMTDDLPRHWNTEASGATIHFAAQSEFFQSYKTPNEATVVRRTAVLAPTGVETSTSVASAVVPPRPGHTAAINPAAHRTPSPCTRAGFAEYSGLRSTGIPAWQSSGARRDSRRTPNESAQPYSVQAPETDGEAGSTGPRTAGTDERPISPGDISGLDSDGEFLLGQDDPGRLVLTKQVNSIKSRFEHIARGR